MTQWISTSKAWSHVAFFEREAAQQKINVKLCGGKLPTWANLFTFEGSEHRDEPMPPKFWDSWTRLDFATGEARRVVTQIFAVPNPTGPGMIVPVLADDRATGVCIDFDTLVSFWPQQPGSQKPKAIESPHPGGRPPAADWMEIQKALEREIELVGFPERSGAPGWRSQADVIQFIRPMLGDDEPSITALKENTKAMLERIKAEMAGN
jgi:hypothetical protein